MQARMPADRILRLYTYSAKHERMREMSVPALLGPFHGAIAVPSVTRCRRWRCRGHRCAGGARQYRQRHLVNGREAARCGEWAQHFSNASCIGHVLSPKVLFRIEQNSRETG